MGFGFVGPVWVLVFGIFGFYMNEKESLLETYFYSQGFSSMFHKKTPKKNQKAHHHRP